MVLWSVAQMTSMRDARTARACSAIGVRLSGEASQCVCMSTRTRLASVPM